MSVKHHVRLASSLIYKNLESPRKSYLETTSSQLKAPIINKNKKKYD